jgi:hypothetical protein
VTRHARLSASGGPPTPRTSKTPTDQPDALDAASPAAAAGPAEPAGPTAPTGLAVSAVRSGSTGASSASAGPSSASGLVVVPLRRSRRRRRPAAEADRAGAPQIAGPPTADPDAMVDASPPIAAWSNRRRRGRRRRLPGGGIRVETRRTPPRHAVTTGRQPADLAVVRVTRRLRPHRSQPPTTGGRTTAPARLVLTSGGPGRHHIASPVPAVLRLRPTPNGPPAVTASVPPGAGPVRLRRTAATVFTRRTADGTTTGNLMTRGPRGRNHPARPVVAVQIRARPRAVATTARERDVPRDDAVLARPPRRTTEGDSR